MKLLNLLLVASIALTAFGIANASPTATAFSVTNLTKISNRENLYSATVTTSKTRATNPASAPIFQNGDLILITTKDCTVPAKATSGIVVLKDVSLGGNTATLLFSSGASCAVSGVDPAEQH